MDRKARVLKAAELGASDAVQYLRFMLHDENAPDRSRIQAAEILLNRAYGRPGIAEAEAEAASAAKDIYEDFLRAVSGEEW
uniref:Uncharacterized protein n=1 Tax=uncultured prokaryote TaxID=198431 RepID=A0A0H5Q6Q0_9ZZZZ|nr:hypothetical protein [uncultured prokaryote]